MYQNPETSELKFPSDAEYRNRIERTQAAMKHAAIDILAISGFDYLRFFTGLNGLPIGRPIWLVFEQQGQPHVRFPSQRSQGDQSEMHDTCRS